MTAVRRVLAPNPGPFTLEGTNTWIVGSDPSVVIDPGPPDERHVRAVAERAGRVAMILLTHHHPDHAPAAAALAGITGAPVLAFDPGPGERRLAGGEAIEGGGVRLTAIHAPGHTHDHLVFHEARDRALFTGDAVLGRGTSVVDPPEGDMAAYVRSLERLLEVGARRIYPGHGPVVEDAGAKLREYVEHRAMRERQVLQGLGDGPRTPEELVALIYADVPPALHPAAARSVLAHLAKLEAEGRVIRVPGRGGRFARHGPSSAEQASSATT